jgi:hypothetical protein
MEKTRQDIIELALVEVGYTESPADSNETKYGAWFGFDGVAWCGMFVSWVFHHAGFPLGNIGFLKGFAGCQTAVAFFKKNGQIVTDPQTGDIAFFDWNGDGRYDHVGIFRKGLDNKGLRFECLEGNTSVSNQSNGGQVMSRSRSYKNVIFARPACLEGIS